jgi:hypothetical protein
VTKTADEITAELVAWIGAATPGVAVTVSPLGGRTRQQGLDLRLLRLTPKPPPRTPDPPWVVDLDYLATVQLEDAAAEQKAAGEVMLAAMARGDVEIVEADVLQLCAALGLPPAPGLVLRTPLVRERDVQPKPWVRQLVLQTSDLGVVAGQVLGPQDIPVTGAVVSVVGLDRAARTDRQGKFKIAAAPAGRPLRLVARAKGVEIEGLATAGQAVTLRLPLED